MKTNAKIQSIRKIANGLFSVAFAQIVIFENSSVNLLALAMEGHEKFKESTPKPRIGWMSFTVEGLKSVLGIDASKLVFTKTTVAGKTQEICMLDIDAPEVAGKSMNLQITESVGPKVKQDGTFDAINNRKRVNVKEGENTIPSYFVKDGGLVYGYTTVVLGEPKHSRIEDAKLVPVEEFEFNLALLSETDDSIQG